MAGDYVILKVRCSAATCAHERSPPEHLEAVASRKPVYAVLGNHDWWKGGRCKRGPRPRACT